MKPVTLFTIPHTGTTFIMKMLFRDGIAQHPFHEAHKIIDLPEQGYYFSHLFSKHLDTIHRYLKETDHVIVPLRNPRDVYVSWYLRNQIEYDEDGDEIDIAKFPVDKFEEAWENLVKMDTDFNPLYLVVDGENKEAQLQTINDTLGISLTTDWTPENASKYTQEQRDAVVYTPPQWITDFYQSKI